ncbi:MAG: hypothetical protein BGO98_08525 [Myxococcales bacterium 68-20]|nr:MAG: hypothetical protein BGO98_08525 [Myxococcales bacterium 68-20]
MAPCVVTSDVAHGEDAQTTGSGPASNGAASRGGGGASNAAAPSVIVDASGPASSGSACLPSSSLEQLRAAPPVAKLMTVARATVEPTWT